MSTPENDPFHNLHPEWHIQPMFCMVCHADLTPYLDQLDTIEEGEDYVITCPECGSQVEPLDRDDLPY